MDRRGTCIIDRWHFKRNRLERLRKEKISESLRRKCWREAPQTSTRDFPRTFRTFCLGDDFCLVLLSLVIRRGLCRVDTRNEMTVSWVRRRSSTPKRTASPSRHSRRENPVANYGFSGPTRNVDHELICSNKLNVYEDFNWVRLRINLYSRSAPVQMRKNPYVSRLGKPNVHAHIFIYI